MPSLLPAFVRRHLDAAGRLGEILFGLIMALGVTGAVRLGEGEADNRGLFVGVFGCNLAWAIEAAVRQIAHELDWPLVELATPEERARLHGWILGILRRERPVAVRLDRKDLLGGVAAAFAIVLATFPVVVPYLVVADPNLAVRVSNLIALSLLFVLGLRWGDIVGASPIGTASGLTVVGLALVLVTILLGG